MKNIIIIMLLGAVLAACGPRGLYNWGGYSSKLNAYYRDPAKQAAYREALEATIAAENGQRIPPGVLAELGYLELAAGNKDAAKRLFQREKAKWPEAGPFMDRMIRQIDEGEPPASAPPSADAEASPPGPSTS